MNTTTTQHTAGPWRINPDSLDVEDSTSRFIAQPRSEYSGIPVDEQEANARLIAAAPDGYAFAQSFLRWTAQMRSVGRELPGMKALEREAQAFIAKATGGEV